MTEVLDEIDVARVKPPWPGMPPITRQLGRTPPPPVSGGHQVPERGRVGEWLEVGQIPVAFIDRSTKGLSHHIIDFAETLLIGFVCAQKTSLALSGQ